MPFSEEAQWVLRHSQSPSRKNNNCVRAVTATQILHTISAKAGGVTLHLRTERADDVDNRE